MNEWITLGLKVKLVIINAAIPLFLSPFYGVRRVELTPFYVSVFGFYLIMILVKPRYGAFNTLFTWRKPYKELSLLKAFFSWTLFYLVMYGLFYLVAVTFFLFS